MVRGQGLAVCQTPALVQLPGWEGAGGLSCSQSVLMWSCAVSHHSTTLPVLLLTTHFWP